MLVGGLAVCDIVEQDAIGARGIEPHNAGHRRGSLDLLHILCELALRPKHDAHQRELRRGRTHAANAEIVEERPEQRFEPVRPAVPFPGRMDDQVVAGSRDVESPAKLAEQLAAHFALRARAEVRRHQAIVAHLPRRKLPEVSVVGQQQDPGVRPRQRRSSNQRAVNFQLDRRLFRSRYHARPAEQRQGTQKGRQRRPAAWRTHDVMWIMRDHT